MEIITLTGPILKALFDVLDVTPEGVHTIRVARDVDGVKIKINESVWSPGCPLADEDRLRNGAK